MLALPVPLSRPQGPEALPEQVLHARRELVFLLQLAYSGELAAARAYAGHRASLRNPAQRAELGRILRDELHHRHCLLAMLKELGAEPLPARERKMDLVGRTISRFCLVGGWFFPMYGAARLESQNIREYELAARLAHVAGLASFVAPLLEMAEVEWDHERYFREQAMRHLLWRVMPGWTPPPPRTQIRRSFEAFTARGQEALPAVRPALLVR
jgi:rubrerythrin